MSSCLELSRFKTAKSLSLLVPPQVRMKDSGCWVLLSSHWMLWEWSKYPQRSMAQLGKAHPRPSVLSTQQRLEQLDALRIW